MHEDTAATAADWLPYRARQSFNLFELAALLCRKDPERLVDLALRARSRDVAPMRDPDDPAMVLGLVQAMPEALLGDDVGGLLKAMQKALGVSNVRAPVSVAEAQRLAALFGIALPPELQAAGAHPMGRFWEGDTAAPAKPKRQTQADRIALCLSECEERAAAADETFDRESMPGQKANFLELLRLYDQKLATIKTVESLDNYLTKTGCKWPLDASASKSARPLYARLFPELYEVPGVVSMLGKKA